jgi:acyl-CoA synthetase (AMP-forming)/AMP-acid ligase II
MENVIREVFNEVWKREGHLPPPLDADTLLLEIGLDSLGFAIVVTQLDEKIGFDPFSIAQGWSVSAPRSNRLVGALLTAQIVPSEPVTARQPFVDRVLAHCRALLMREAVPATFRLVDELETNAPGKIRRASRARARGTERAGGS